MSDGETSSIRLHGETYDKLKELKGDDESVRDVLNRVIPEDVGEVERIDEDVVVYPVPREFTERVNQMAGDNVSANDVIDKLLEDYERNSS